MMGAFSAAFSEAFSHEGEASEGLLAQGIGNLGLTAEGELALRGLLAQDIGLVGLSAEGKAELSGELSQGIGLIGLEATGLMPQVPIFGELAQGIGEIRLIMAGNQYQRVLVDRFERKRPRKNPFIRPWRTGW